MKIHPYYKNKIKERLGIRSPSVQMAAFGRAFATGLVIGRQDARLRDLKERAFERYKLKPFFHAPEYQPLVTIVKEFRQSVEWYNDDYGVYDD